MEVKATAKWLRISASKVRRLAKLIRRKPASEALVLLKFMPQKSALILGKVLKSAAANAKNNFKLDESKLVISRILIDEAPAFDRFQARARGRGFAIKKRNCHVSIFVKEKK